MIPGANNHVRRHQQALAAFFRDQRRDVLPRVEVDAPIIFDPDRWNRELTAVVLGLAQRTVMAFGGEVAAQFGTGFHLDTMGDWLFTYSRLTARAINETTADSLNEALERARMPALKALSDDPDEDYDPDDPLEAAGHVFAVAIGSRALVIGESKVTTEANFGRTEAAIQADRPDKTWLSTSGKPRHASLSGETVAIGETFSNGANWPGDPVLPVSERANCSCIVDFGS